MAVIHTAGSDYEVRTEVYEGPLDLLLDLIVKSELDITRLALAAVTDQYLAHLADLQQNSAVEVSGFLVIAAKLVQIKSEALLPRPPEREEGEEDPAESLARQLKIYRAVKTTSKWLHNRESEGLHAYIRLAPPPIIEEELDLTGVTIDNLVAMLQSLYRFQEEASPITSVVTIPKVTIKNKIQELLWKLQQQTTLSYRGLLPKKYDRVEAIVLFLAILEMVKQRYAVAEQNGLFADIDISPTDKTFNEDEIVLALED